MEKKGRLLGIKLICVLMLFFILMFIAKGVIFKLVESSPRSFKVSLLEEGTLNKYFNINSIEEFDKFFKKESFRTFHPYSIFILTLIAMLMFGLWSSKEWARIGTILYGGYLIILRIITLGGARVIPVVKFGCIIHLILFIVLILYLTRPKVKEQFR